MTRIAISSNTLVDYSPERWRLIKLDDQAKPKLLLEAKSNLPLRFSGAFALTRDLPAAGEILQADLGQVVLGWSQQTQSWQLGITLSEAITRARSSRWFEVLRLTDADPATRESEARQLGKALASTLGIALVAKDEADVPEPEPEPEPVPLRELPLDLGMWRLERGDGQDELHLRRQPRWLAARRRQIAWYALWTLIYTWVALATLNNELGLPNAGTLIPNPDWLPYLALVVAALLLLLILRQCWRILRVPNNIVINPYSKSICGLRGEAQRWQINAGSVQAVYASEVLRPAKRGRLPFTGSSRSTFYHGEINLHLLDDSFFRLLLDQEKRTDVLLPGVDPANEKKRGEGVHALEAIDASTALQAASLHIARALGELPVWYDRRLK